MQTTVAAIITIGDELLIGQVIDTNSAFIAQELNKIGVNVIERIAVGDNREAIWGALDRAFSEAQIIIITGGLGPTADDITKPLLCEYFQGKMVVHEETLQFITHLFEQVFQRPMIERNRKQAEVPDTCIVLQNEQGTAPGMLFERDGRIAISLPGVPFEMKWLMTHKVIPVITNRFELGHIVHKSMLTVGVGESFLAEMIAEEEAALPPSVKLAYLPNYGMVRLRLTGYGEDENAINELVSLHFETIFNKVKNYVVAKEDIPMEVIVGRLLHATNSTVATAESCTGGNIAQLITSVPGASAYFKGSVVSYDNAVKESVLHVQPTTLEKYGAVSAEVVTEMAQAIQTIMQTDYAIAVSGIMGPEGGKEDKPVGTVWVAIINPKMEVITHQFKFRFDRSRNIQLTSINALSLLRNAIVDNSGITFPL